MREIERFRYRVEDTAKKVTRVMVREARASELKAEMLNSSKLSGYFEEHAGERRTCISFGGLLPASQFRAGITSLLISTHFWKHALLEVRTSGSMQFFEAPGHQKYVHMIVAKFPPPWILIAYDTAPFSSVVFPCDSA
ncbi:unnamed protein product [Discosporangium mesarthrocarpum]